MDFVLTPDAERIIAIFTNIKRTAIDGKLKPAMSARPVEEPLPGIPGGTVGGLTESGAGGFGYGSMEHGLMVVRISDREIVEWVV